MNRRSLLRAWVNVGLLICATGFAGIFVYGLFPPGTDSTGQVIDIGGLPEGAARLEAWHGRPVWVVHRSAHQLEALGELSAHVLVPEAEQPPRVDNPHRALRREYGVYLAETDRSGILVQYVRERPRRLGSKVAWYGGFVDPGGDALFDVAGRRYRATRGGPLRVPPHRYTADDAIRLGDW